MQLHGRLDPELGLALGVLHMHVRPRLLAREEVEPKPLDAQDRWTHSDRIAHHEILAIPAGSLPIGRDEPVCDYVHAQALNPSGVAQRSAA